MSKLLTVLTVLFTILLSTSYASAKNDTIVPVKDDFFILYLIQNVLPKIHFTGGSIDNSVGEKVADNILSSMNDYGIVYKKSDFQDLLSQSERIAAAIKSADLNSLFQIVDGLYQTRIEFYEVAIEDIKSLTEEDLSKRVIYSGEIKKGYLPTPINDSHRLELIRRLIASFIAEKLAASSSFSDAKQSVLNVFNEKILILNENRDNDHYLEVILNSLLNSFDNHSRYVSHRNIQALRSAHKNEDYKIGLDLSLASGILTITNIVAGSVADELNTFKEGDELIEIEFMDVTYPLKGRTPRYLSELVAGFSPLDSSIVLVCKRDGKEYRATVKRGKVSNAPLSIQRYTSVLNNLSSNYLSIPSFYDGLFDEVKKEIDKHKGENIIIDLRGNGGGSLIEAVNVTSLFMNGGNILTTKDIDGQLSFNDSDNFVFSGKIVILVDRNTASAAEIMASALQYHKRAVIVGEKTFGKGTVQRFFDFSSPEYMFPIDSRRLGGLLITIAAYYSPNGESVHLNGITPDVELSKYISVSTDNIKNLDVLDASTPYVPESVEWQYEFKEKIESSLLEMPLYRYYLNNSRNNDDLNKTKIEQFLTEKGREKERDLDYLNFNRRFQDMEAISNMSVLESDYRLIDVVLNASVTALQD